MNTEIKHNLICRCPACAGDGGAPPAPTVSTGAGGENLDRCPFCEADNNTGVFYLCGTTVGSFNQTTECRRVQEIVKEVKRLEAWKAEVVAVEAKWDAQAIAAMLGSRLGESTRTAIQREVPLLLERMKRLHDAGQDAIDYINGKHRDAGRVLDGWRKANK